MIGLTVMVCAGLLALVECSGNMPAMSLLHKSLSCANNHHVMSCLSARATLILERASSLDKLSIWGDSIALVKAPLENATDIPETSSEKSLGDRFSRFLETRRIQVRLPPLSYFIPTPADTAVTGRKKGNKGYGVIAMTIVGAMMATGMAGLAMMAGKALAASMAALLLAAIAAMRKGGGGGHHSDGPSSYEVISIPSHQHRSFLDEQPMRNPYKYDTDEHVHQKRR